MDKRVTNPLKEIEKPASGNNETESTQPLTENTDINYVRCNTSDGVVIYNGKKYIQVSKDERLYNLYNSALDNINSLLSNTESTGIATYTYKLDGINEKAMTNSSETEVTANE